MRTIICIPAMDMIHTDFARALLGLRHRDEVQITFSQNSLVYDGRNKLAEAAVSGGFDRALWLDSDVIFTPELEEHLHRDLDEGREIVSALYFSRRQPVKPVVYKEIASDPLPGGGFSPRADSFFDYPADSVFPIAACGFGAVMMTVEVLRRIRERFGLPFSPILGFGEDLSFCMRATEIGETIWCDSRIKLGHVGLAVYDEETYRQRPVKTVNL